jgi:hypothetical protein
MIAGGFACLVHAVLPAVFEHSASRTVAALHVRMVTNRRRKVNAEVDYAI